MNCHRINRSGKPAGRLHSLFCAQCRASQRTDDLLAFGIVQLRRYPASHTALNRTLAVLDLPPIAEDYGRLRRQRRRTRGRRAAVTSATLAVFSWFTYMSWLPAEPSVSLFPQSGSDTTALQAAAETMHLHIVQPVYPKATTANSDELRLDVPYLKVDEDAQIKFIEDHPALHSGPKVDAVGHFVEENRHALDLIHAALPIPFRERTLRTLKEVREQQGPLLLQADATLLHADAAWKFARGDRSGAFQEALNMIEFGENIAGGGSLNSRLLGWKSQNDGRLILWRLLPQMSVHETLQACQRLDAIRRRHTPLQTTIQWERATGAAVLRDILGRPMWRWDYARNFVNPYAEFIQEFEHLRVTGSLYTISNQHILRNFLDFMEAAERECSGPYRPGVGKRLPAAMPPDRVNQSLQPEFAGIPLADVYCEAQNAMLTTALALHAYRTEHGVNPPTLKALCPHYLTEVPTDPFRAGSPLLYAPNHPHFHSFNTSSTRAEFLGKDSLFALPPYLLYSVGPDGIDQQGAFIFGRDPSTLQQKLHGDSESKGDLVAWINM